VTVMDLVELAQMMRDPDPKVRAAAVARARKTTAHAAGGAAAAYTAADALKHSVGQSGGSRARQALTAGGLTGVAGASAAMEGLGDASRPFVDKLVSGGR